MSRRLLTPLLLPTLTLPLLLTACPQPEPPVAICAQSLSTASIPAAEVVHVNTPAPNWAAPHVAGQVLIVQQGNSGLSAQSLGILSTVRTEKVVNGVTRAYTPAGENDRAFAQRLEAAGLNVQPNFIYHALATPNDPGVPGNAGINFTNGTSTIKAYQTYLTRIKALEAWNFLAGCGKTPVAASTAVLDSGIEATHTDLTGRASAIQSYVSTHSYDHGTATTGLIAANTNNTKGIAGVTWSGSVMHLEVIDGNGDATTDTIAQGLDYAVGQGAKVVNMSLGGPDSVTNPGDTILDASLANAAKTAVLVAAAGNTANQGVYYPASNPNVIAVGALGASDGALACYSARPSATLPRALDIVAPGGAGYGACVGATPDQDMLLLAPGNTYALEAGTSFAAPLVSGVAALMRAANPNLTAGQTKTLLLNSVNTASGLPLLDANAAVRAATK